MRTKISLLSLAALFLISCGNSKKVDKEIPKDSVDRFEIIKSLSWILGKWEMNNNPGITTETWIVLNDSVYAGESVTIGSGKDTIFHETITIEQWRNDVFYIPVVKDQNDGNRIMFKLRDQENNQQKRDRAIFENFRHDFPQVITYELKGDSLLASISAMLIEGKEHTERFPMVRSK